VLLCSFHRFEIWEPGRYPMNPRISFPLDQLPDRYESLLFLASARPGPMTTRGGKGPCRDHHGAPGQQAESRGREPRPPMRNRKARWTAYITALDKELGVSESEVTAALERIQSECWAEHRTAMTQRLDAAVTDGS